MTRSRETGTRRRHGFTLMEVLLALVVTGLAVTILAQGFTMGGRASSTARKRTRAVWIAERLMTDVEIGAIAYNRGAQGEWTEDPAYRYEVRSEQGDVLDTYRITVVVSWDEGTEERSYALTRLLFRPQTQGNE